MFFHRLAAFALTATLATSAFAASPVASGVKRLKELFTHNSTVKTKTQDPVKMLYRFLYAEHAPSEVKEMKLVTGQKKIQTDTAVAGILTAAAAAAEVSNAWLQMQMDAGVDLDDAAFKDLAKTVREMAKAGVTFAYDGLAQNEGPTPYLLVIDPSTHTVTGFDLAPSEP